MTERDTSGLTAAQSETESIADCETKPIPPAWSCVRGVSMVIAGAVFIANDEEYTGILLIGTGLLMINHYHNRLKIKK